MKLSQTEVPKANDIVHFRGARARVKQVSRDGRFTLRLIESAPGLPAHSKLQVRLDQIERPTVTSCPLPEKP